MLWTEKLAHFVEHFFHGDLHHTTVIERALGEKASAARNMVPDEVVHLAEGAFPKGFVGAEENE